MAKVPKNRLGSTPGYNPINGLYYGSDGKTYSANELTSSELAMFSDVSEVTGENNTSTQEDFQEQSQSTDGYTQQVEFITKGKAMPVNKDIINVWNRFRKMSTMELSTFSPFVVIFLVVTPSIFEGTENEPNKFDDIKWYTANIKGLGERIVFPIGATKNIYETTNFSGGIGITNFEIGWLGNIGSIRGSFSYDVMSLDEFDNNFLGAALLSPYNTVISIHGWSGVGIWNDLPFDLENGDIWNVKIESLNPGYSAVNTLNISKRDYTLTESGYNCVCTLTQHSQTQEGSDKNTDTKNDNKSKTSFDQFSTYTNGSSESIFENLIDKSKIIGSLNNVYKDENYNYIIKKINDTWFSSQDDYVKNYSLTRKNENGVEEAVHTNIYYPLGLVAESIITAHFNKNQSEPIMRIVYEDVSDPETNENIKLPEFSFSISDGNESKTFTLPIKSAFDIPIPYEKIKKILQTPETQWREALYKLFECPDDEYRIAYIGINKTINECLFNMSLEFMEQKISKEIIDSDRKPLDENTDLVFEYRSQNSLIGNISLEASNINLESLAALGYNNIMGQKTSMLMDVDESGNTEVTATTSKQSTEDDNTHKYNKDDITDGGDIGNTKLISNLSGNESFSRGFLIRLFAQILNIDTHGIAGLLPFQRCWVRGLTKGLNGKYVINSIKDIVTPNSYVTNLQLLNLNYSQDSTGLQSIKQNTSNTDSDNSTTNTNNEETDNSKDSKQNETFGKASGNIKLKPVFI